MNNIPHDLLNSPQKKLLLIGMGEAGHRVANEIFIKRPKWKIIGYLDDIPPFPASKSIVKLSPIKKAPPPSSKKATPSSSKKEIKYLGKISHLKKCAQMHSFDGVVIAIEYASRKLLEKVVMTLDAKRYGIYIIPANRETISPNTAIENIRPLIHEDLIGRKSLSLNEKLLVKRLKGKSILVTGAGGSIGSELCKQLLSLPVKKIIALSRGENSLFSLQEKIERESPAEKKIDYYVGNAGDKNLLDMLYDYSKIDVIFHAAAHKHVPLMEKQETEAFKNNIAVTRVLLDFSRTKKIQHFVLISTDKAVNPSTVMGKSKRIAEKLCHHYSTQFSLPTSVVRFGNVISSRGSVVPLFQRQIRFGGPITVTDPACYRYFMTITEAALLALNAYGLSNQALSKPLASRVKDAKKQFTSPNKKILTSLESAEKISKQKIVPKTYMLDMGEEIAIDTLVRLMIRLEGFIPEKNMSIKYIGLRKGEKLHEELFAENEKHIVTENPNIFEIQTKAPSIDATKKLTQNKGERSGERNGERSGERNGKRSEKRRGERRGERRGSSRGKKWVKIIKSTEKTLHKKSRLEIRQILDELCDNAM